MTKRTRDVFWRPEDTLDLNAADAHQYGVKQGERVRVVSRYGEAQLPVRIVDRLQWGHAFATFHCAEALVNGLTGSGRDRLTATPEYKVTAIRIEKLA
jgi:formate dehydrogenase major subunit